MTLPPIPPSRADILASSPRADRARSTSPVLQPADPFLDMAGEDLRRRIFLTESETGETLCLRPGIHHPRLPRPHRQPRRHAAPLFLSRRGVSPAPRGRQRVLPGRHRGSRRAATPPRPMRARWPMRMALLALAAAGPAADGHARRPVGVRGGAGSPWPAARLANAAGARLRRAAMLAAALADLADPPRNGRSPARSPHLCSTATEWRLSTHIAGGMETAGLSADRPAARRTRSRGG